MMRFYLVALGLALGATPPVTVRVTPSVLMGGASVYITCRVAPHSGNRELRAGIGNYTETGRQLEGLNAPITHMFRFDHVPCDAEAAYCTLLRNDGSLTMAKANLLVSCS